MNIEICVKKIHRTPVKKKIYIYIFTETTEYLGGNFLITLFTIYMYLLCIWKRGDNLIQNITQNEKLFIGHTLFIVCNSLYASLCTPSLLQKNRRKFYSEKC